MRIEATNTIRIPSSVTDRALMNRVGQAAILMIRRRTLAGRDREGQAFQPYSDAYAKRKADELGYAGAPNLMVSGDMLNGLTVTAVDDKSVTLGWVR